MALPQLQADFFARQDRARRSTSFLLVYFVLAVTLIVVALNLVAIPFSIFFGADGFLIHFGVTLITLAVILGGCMYKLNELSGGGTALAEMIRARPVQANTTDERERMLRNVVEEMAIAAGITPPRVYVMPGEKGINAFAAGRTVNDAVVCVTSGSLDRLNRDELQGIIAHEFSHILNGDMSMNLKLVGMLHGILLIGLLGMGIMKLNYAGDADAGLGYSDFDSSGNDDKAWAVIIFLFLGGMVVTIIGYVGLFFARLIQAAVCRQREYLADASAVQFTRNPHGIGGALKKLGSGSRGSRLNAYYAEQLAHMFFASNRGDGIDWNSTHPEVPDRIRAVEPDWDGKFPRMDGPTTLAKFSGSQAASSYQPLRDRRPEAVVKTVGAMTPGHVQWASDFLSDVPQTILHAARDAFSARGLIFALLLSEDSTVRQKQLDTISQTLNHGAVDETLNLIGPVTDFGVAGRRVLCDLAIPALRELSDPQKENFLQTCRVLIEADGRVTIFEFMLHEMITAQLQANPRPQTVQYVSLKPVMPDVQVVLSALASTDGKSPQASAQAFRAGVARLQTDASLWQLQTVDLRSLRTSLERLARCSPGVKRRVVDACAYCVAADGLVQVEESELLRVVTSLLACPLPPLLAEHEPLRTAV